MAELDYLLSIDETGVIVHENADAEINQIREWLHTPRGSIWGIPSWGNVLSQYKHEPANDDTAASIENSILLSIGNDLPGITLTRIGVEALDIDLFKVILVTKSDIIEEVLEL